MIEDKVILRHFLLPSLLRKGSIILQQEPGNPFVYCHCPNILSEVKEDCCRIEMGQMQMPGSPSPDRVTAILG